MMRVVCLVPSWTETLLECGVEVVGRTRFCIHPADRVAAIPIVGGTKDLKTGALAALRPDLVILDREENPREFAESLPCPFLATHVDSVASLAAELERLAGALGNSALGAWAARARALAQRPPRAAPPAVVPGVIEALAAFDPGRPVTYLIWRGPWMAAGPGTYIQDVLLRLGFRLQGLPEGKYPTLADDDVQGRFLFFSSEPFPFARKTADLRAAGLEGLVVDGEGFSWFGVRGIRFLEENLEGPERRA